MRKHPASETEASENPSPVLDSTRPTLLVIDGDCVFVELAKSVGETMGFNVVASKNASDLAEMCDRFDPSLIVFDFFSPDMDGIELVNWLYARRSDVQVLLTTEKKSIFLGLAKQLAAARGLRNVELMMEPANSELKKERLARRLEALK